ncbi:hypothetical protein BZA77DRAFT_342110 [Pyronema omphalodes]|nr:hypothetical protein BZA77DRAFT_342110 [Pyronema omphalodes]
MSSPVQQRNTKRGSKGRGGGIQPSQTPHISDTAVHQTTYSNYTSNQAIPWTEDVKPNNDTRNPASTRGGYAAALRGFSQRSTPLVYHEAKAEHPGNSYGPPGPPPPVWHVHPPYYQNGPAVPLYPMTAGNGWAENTIPHANGMPPNRKYPQYRRRSPTAPQGREMISISRHDFNENSRRIAELKKENAELKEEITALRQCMERQKVESPKALLVSNENDRVFRKLLEAKTSPQKSTQSRERRPTFPGSGPPPKISFEGHGKRDFVKEIRHTELVQEHTSIAAPQKETPRGRTTSRDNNTVVDDQHHEEVMQLHHSDINKQASDSAVKEVSEMNTDNSNGETHAEVEAVENQLHEQISTDQTSQVVRNSQEPDIAEPSKSKVSGEISTNNKQFSLNPLAQEFRAFNTTEIAPSPSTIYQPEQQMWTPEAYCPQDAAGFGYPGHTPYSGMVSQHSQYGPNGYPMDFNTQYNQPFYPYDSSYGQSRQYVQGPQDWQYVPKSEQTDGSPKSSGDTTLYAGDSDAFAWQTVPVSTANGSIIYDSAPLPKIIVDNSNNSVMEDNILQPTATGTNQQKTTTTDCSAASVSPDKIVTNMQDSVVAVHKFVWSDCTSDDDLDESKIIKASGVNIKGHEIPVLTSNKQNMDASTNNIENLAHPSVPTHKKTKKKSKPKESPNKNGEKVMTLEANADVFQYESTSAKINSTASERTTAAAPEVSPLTRARDITTSEQESEWLTVARTRKGSKKSNSKSRSSSSATPRPQTPAMEQKKNQDTILPVTAVKSWAIIAQTGVKAGETLEVPPIRQKTANKPVSTTRSVSSPLPAVVASKPVVDRRGMRKIYIPVIPKETTYEELLASMKGGLIDDVFISAQSPSRQQHSDTSNNHTRARNLPEGQSFAYVTFYNQEAAEHCIKYLRHIDHKQHGVKAPSGPLIQTEGAPKPVAFVTLQGQRHAVYCRLGDQRPLQDDVVEVVEVQKGTRALLFTFRKNIGLKAPHTGNVTVWENWQKWFTKDNGSAGTGEVLKALQIWSGKPKVDIEKIEYLPVAPVAPVAAELTTARTEPAVSKANSSTSAQTFRVLVRCTRISIAAKIRDILRGNHLFREHCQITFAPDPCSEVIVVESEQNIITADGSSDHTVKAGSEEGVSTTKSSRKNKKKKSNKVLIEDKNAFPDLPRTKTAGGNDDQQYAKPVEWKKPSPPAIRRTQSGDILESKMPMNESAGEEDDANDIPAKKRNSVAF